MAWSSVARPQMRDERQQHERRQRREGQEAAARSPSVVGDRQDVLEVARCPSSSPAVARPGSGWPPGPRGRPRPATRSGCSSDRRPVTHVDRQRREGQDRGRSPPASQRAERPSGRPADRAEGPRGPPGDPVLRSDPPSTLVQEPFPVTGPAIRRARARHTSAVAGDRDAGSRRRGPRGPRARSRPPTHHRIPPARVRVRGRPRRVPVLGDRTSPRTGRAASTTATSSTTTRPATCTSCGWSGSSGRRSAASGDLIKVPAILADLAIGWLVWSMVLELGGRRQARRSRRPSSLSSTRSAGSTASSGARSTRSVSSSSCSALRDLWRDQPERSRRLRGGRRDHQAPARDPHPDPRGGDDPARALAGRRSDDDADDGPADRRAGPPDDGRLTGSAWERRTVPSASDDRPFGLSAIDVCYCLPFELDRPAVLAPGLSPDSPPAATRT